MNIDWVLPQPTEDELNLGFKVDYFNRLINDEVLDEKKYRLTREQMLDWIHHNYSSIFLTGEELTLTKYKKLIK